MIIRRLCGCLGLLDRLLWVSSSRSNYTTRVAGFGCTADAHEWRAASGERRAASGEFWGDYKHHQRQVLADSGTYRMALLVSNTILIGQHGDVTK